MYIKNYELFYTGRHAIKALLLFLGTEQHIHTIWLPNYYCQHVTSWLIANFSNIDFYEIDPFNSNSTIDITSFTKAHDIVILNNFWGIFNYTIPKTKNEVVYVEDHSHGWLSPSCLNSNADYCFASLRKTLPVPLGGILWKGDGTKITLKSNTFSEDDSFYYIWDSNEKAMKIKNDYADNDTSLPKDSYLKPIGAAEEYLHEQHDVVKMEKKHIDYIESFIRKDYNFYKAANLNVIISKLLATDLFKVIQNEDKITFGLLLLFKNYEVFEKLKSYLIQNSIYPSQLWPGNKLASEWKFLLNIHLDFRYGTNEMNYIRKTINAWITSN
jgi:hypothetical protein